MKDGEQFGHDVIDLPSLKFSFVIAKHFFAGVVDLVHDSALFSIEFKKDDSMFFAGVRLAAC